MDSYTMTQDRRVEIRLKKAMELSAEGKHQIAFEELLDAILEMNGYDSNSSKIAVGFGDYTAILKKHETEE